MSGFRVLDSVPVTFYNQRFTVFLKPKSISTVLSVMEPWLRAENYQCN
jgi:hypothetical protein